MKLHHDYLNSNNKKIIIIIIYHFSIVIEFAGIVHILFYTCSVVCMHMH